MRPKRADVPKPPMPPSDRALIRAVASERFVRLDGVPHQALLVQIREPGEAPYNVIYCIELGTARGSLREATG